VVRELLADYGDLRYVWRHPPLIDVHPHAQLAAEATETAANQDKFGLNADRLTQDMRGRTGQPKVISDVDSADLSGVSATPTFFINGSRRHGAYDIDTPSAAVRAARPES
jgi:protein-disulfide isomerase